MNNAASKLKRCGPLTDTIGVAERFLRANIMFALVAPSLVAFLAGLAAKDSKLSAAMLGQFALGGLLGLGLALPSLRATFLVLRESRRPRELCVFLRAFRSDSSSDQLRAWLKASLGTGFRLSGIRPPNERASPLLTFLSPLITGLRYAGSRQFELEAPDRNWMARLLATFAEARLVFIDVRDVTPHVVDEVQLAWKVFGPGRVIFITDDSRSDAAWADWIMAQLGDSKVTPQDLKRLAWPEGGPPDSSAFASGVQTLVNGIPQGVPDVSDDAVAFAETRVKPENWDVRLMEKPWALIICSLMAVALLLLAVRMGFPSFVHDLLAAVLLLVFQAMFWRAWNRARRQRKFAKQINPQGPPSAARVIEAAIWMTLTLVVTLLMVLLALTEPMYVGEL